MQQEAPRRQRQNLPIVPRTEAVSSTLKVGNLSLDCTTFELKSPTDACRLPNKEFQVMELLAANPSQVISTDRNVKIKAARGQGYYLEIQS